MAKPEFTQAEINELLHGVQLATKSAERAQNAGRTPQIKEVYKSHSETLKQLEAKLLSYK